MFLLDGHLKKGKNNYFSLKIGQVVSFFCFGKAGTNMLIKICKFRCLIWYDTNKHAKMYLPKIIQINI